MNAASPEIPEAGLGEKKVAKLDSQIVELQKQRREMTLVDAPREVEVTCVLAVYNAFMWFGRAIFCLEIGAQSIPLDLIICDNSSTDPCKDILKGDGFRNWIEGHGPSGLKSRGFEEVEILNPVPQMVNDEKGPITDPKRRAYRNMDFMWTKLTRHVKTEFILYVGGSFRHGFFPQTDIFFNEF